MAPHPESSPNDSRPEGGGDLSALRPDLLNYAPMTEPRSSWRWAIVLCGVPLVIVWALFIVEISYVQLTGQGVMNGRLPPFLKTCARGGFLVLLLATVNAFVVPWYVSTLPSYRRGGTLLRGMMIVAGLAIYLAILLGTLMFYVTIHVV